MSEAVKGFGDRWRVSVAGVASFDVDGENSIYQTNNGVSARVSPDLVDGGLILAPHIGLAWSRVEARRHKEVTISLEGRDEGWGGPEELPYRVDVERATADRFSPSAGFAVGWLEGLRCGYDDYKCAAIGVQAMFEVRRDLFGDYQIERYPDQTIDIDAKDAKSWGLRAGVELLSEPYRFGERGEGPGLGILFGLYWMRGVNAITHEGGQDNVEASFGLLATFE